MDLKQMMLEDFTRAAAFVVLYVIIFLLAKWAKDFLIPYKLNEELAENDNFAVTLAMCGYYTATAAIFIGALFGPTQDLAHDLMLVGSYSILGLVFLNLSRFLNERFLLRTFCDTEHLVTQQNISVGAVHCGVYIATGIIAAGAITGEGGSFISAIIFFLLGQISLFLFSFIYAYLAPYDVHKELEQKNIGAGIAFGGNLVALSIIILNGVSGDFTSWQSDLLLFFSVNVMAFIFLPVVRYTMDSLVIPGNAISKEIRDDHNIGAGLLEAVIAISFATIVLQVM